MRFTLSVAAIAACASMVTAAPLEEQFLCAAEAPASFIEQSIQMAKDEAEGLFHASAQDSIQIETYFHVVASSNAVKDAYVSDKMLQDQLNVLNSDYKPHGISFDLVNISRTINPTWAVDGAEIAMKKSLRRGGYDALNVYFMKEIGGALGYCYFPANVVRGSDDYTRDGCSILATTVPGGSETNYNLGGTTTHEVGHYLGLFHTFQGGCQGGDSVADTPAQSSPTSGCPARRDSCPNIAGDDPIHNYMDYSYDVCYEEFTAGQRTRMYNSWNTFRAGK